MATLDDRVKTHIVQGLAQYMTPTEVVKSVKEEFAIEIDRQQVAFYDPTKVTGRQLGAKWRAIFEAARAQFLTDVAAVPIANLAYRLRIYQEQLDSTKSPVLKLQILEQATKDVGGLYTNQRKQDNTSSDGSLAQRPTVIELVAPQGGTDEGTD